MKTFIMLLALISTVGFSGLAFAEPGDIRCHAEFRVLTKDGIMGAVEKRMVKTAQDTRTIRFESEVEGRTFTLSGDFITGDFMLSQNWGEGYTEGVLSTTSFNSSGRLQMSTVDTYTWFDPKEKDLPREEKKYPDGIVGSRVYKLVCNKTLASQFPNQ